MAYVILFYSPYCQCAPRVFPCRAHSTVTFPLLFLLFFVSALFLYQLCMPALKIATSATDSGCRASRCQSVSALCVCVCSVVGAFVCLVVCALLCVQKFCKLAVLGRLKTICHFVLSRRVFGCFRCFWLATEEVGWWWGNAPTKCCRIHLYRFFHLGYLQWSLKHTHTHTDTHPTHTHTHQLTY